MMKLTRQKIKDAKTFGILWYAKNKHIIKLSTQHILRNNLFILDENHYYNILNNIEFIYDDNYKHWAETDGETIWINTYKPWTQSSLNYTIIHECIHGLIKIGGKHFTSEYKEHLIMESINSNLV